MGKILPTTTSPIVPPTNTLTPNRSSNASAQLVYRGKVLHFTGTANQLREFLTPIIASETASSSSMTAPSAPPTSSPESTEKAQLVATSPLQQKAATEFPLSNPLPTSGSNVQQTKDEKLPDEERRKIIITTFQKIEECRHPSEGRYRKGKYRVGFKVAELAAFLKKPRQTLNRWLKTWQQHPNWTPNRESLSDAQVISMRDFVGKK